TGRGDESVSIVTASPLGRVPFGTSNASVRGFWPSETSQLTDLTGFDHTQFSHTFLFGNSRTSFVPSCMVTLMVRGETSWTALLISPRTQMRPVRSSSLRVHPGGMLLSCG